MLRILRLVLPLILLVLAAPSVAKDRPLTVLISIDGFRRGVD